MDSDKYTLQETHVDVGDGHQIYTQLWGNENAKETVLFLHGGPGGGVSDSHKTRFDPSKQKVLFFDQRGAGKSVPYGSLEYNTTDDLIEDVNKLAEYFGIENCAITGNSWGSCLALAYAIKFPKKVRRMVLSGIFTARQNEINFLTGGGAKTFFPDAWQEFLESVPEKYRENPGKYHTERVLRKDQTVAKESAFALAQLMGAVVTLDDRVKMPDFAEFDPVPVIIECHYMKHQCFLPEGYILQNAAKLSMPVDIVQGRYDSMCPPETAWELYQTLPDARLHWTLAGHAGGDRNNWEVVKALLAR